MSETNLESAQPSTSSSLPIEKLATAATVLVRASTVILLAYTIPVGMSLLSNAELLWPLIGACLDIMVSAAAFALSLTLYLSKFRESQMAQNTVVTCMVLVISFCCVIGVFAAVLHH